MYIHAYRHIPDPDRVEYTRCVLKPCKDIWNQMFFCKSADVCTVSNDVCAPGDIPDHDVIGKARIWEARTAKIRRNTKRRLP